ncbi:replication protein A 70 kDa DNA-binding subunit A [Striga asiatica]|uniref:Replication protein A 70 kDa DNA-binding subunit A n=1 Tax=Striga asiatica TaxID=4170 RepID=A0A5A7PM37_STRAF|nr:replication protein A 70 kDa DNA-binding subunit A [Striga asiatica]
MSRVYLPIHQISDETNNWTALIQVVERPPVQTSKNNTSTLYRRYLFTDEEGTKVSAVVYNAVINEFDELLMPYKRYYLSGAKVWPEVPLYQVSDYKYNWLIVSGTNVEEDQESLPPQLPCHIDIHTFADIHKYADTDNPRIVVHAFPVRNLGKNNKTRDLVIVNQEEKPMLLTLWNQFENDEGLHLANTVAAGNVLLAMRIKVTTFNGLSLSTKVGACLMVNPPMAAAAELKQWYIENKNHVTQLVIEETYRNTDKLIPMPEMTAIVTVHNAVAVMRSVPLANNNPRSNGTMNAVIYGEDAERLITYSGNQLFEADQQGRDLTNEIAASVARHKVVCFVKQSESAYHTVVKLYSIQMMMLQGNASTAESSGKESSTAAPSKATDPTLFSPTLKNVLESVALKIEKSPNVPTPESSTKKRINFDAQQDTTQTSSSTPTRSTLQPTQNTATSPYKKSRPKMD